MKFRTWLRWIPVRTWLLFDTCFSLLVVCVSVSATAHLPIGRTAWPILILCCGLAIVLAIRSRHLRPTQRPILPSVVATILILGAVIVALWGSLINGEFVSVYPDPWSYSAIATYLHNQAPQIGGGSRLITLYGAQMMGTRLATPGLLALFAEISGTDTCRQGSIYAFLVLCHVSVGFILLARALGGGPILSFGAGLFGVTVGWVPEILKIGNWDQALFLSLIPFALLRIRLLCFQTSSVSGILGLGFCLAAATFAYPEGLALSGVMYLPLVVWRLLRGAPPPGKMRQLALALGVAIVLSVLYLPTFISFLAHQISAGTTVFVAKGVLGGLLSKNWLAAVYCLGAQLPATNIHQLMKLELIVALLFIGLTFVALGIWWRKRNGILLTVPMFLLLCLWQAGLLRYDYGFYKVLTMFWPVMIAAIFVGVSQLLAWCRGLARPAVAVGFCGLIAGAIFEEVEDFPYAPWREERRVQPFLELTRLEDVSGNAPIRIATQNWFNQLWAVFFLQKYTVQIPNPLLHLRSVVAGPENDVGEHGKGTFVLTDEKKPGAIWHNDVFYLLNHEESVEVIAIDAPNSVETVEGNSFFWLDNRFASLTVRSDADRKAVLVIPECRPGPDRPEDSRRTLVVDVNSERVEVPASANLKMPLSLKKGNNLIRLACKEPATVHKLASQDPRTLLLGIKGCDVRPGD